MSNLNLGTFGDKRNSPRMNADGLAHLPKHRRDWLEIFGDTWGSNKPVVEPMTAEEKQALHEALNPFSR